MSRPRSRQVTWQRLRHADASPPCHSQSRISSFKQTPTLFDSGNSAVSRDISAQFKSEWLQLVFRKLHCCVSNLRNLSIASIYVTVSVRHEAAQAGLAWGQLQLWILSQVRVTLSPHYSLTWPHHYHHSNIVNHDDSDALSSLSFIISAHRKMSCFSVFSRSQIVKNTAYAKGSLAKNESCNDKISKNDFVVSPLFLLLSRNVLTCRVSVSSNEGMTIWSSAFENLLRTRLGWIHMINENSYIVFFRIKWIYLGWIGCTLKFSQNIWFNKSIYL